MTNDNENFERSINSLTKLVNSILNLTSEEMKEKYPDYPIKHFEYLRKNKLEQILEIRLDNENCTLHCEFDKLWYCSAVYMFFDFNLEAYDYKMFLGYKYKYQWFLRRWKTQDEYYLKVIKLDDLVYFKCFKK